ncbi:MAG TPA: hypothetical protein VI479_08260, partial [Blastocatellia bacterium]
LLFEMDPEDPKNVVMTLLQPPSGQGRFLIRQTISVSEGEDLFKDWKLTEQRVAGAIERRGEREPGLGDFPAISYSVQFDAPVFNEPKVTADLKGKAAKDSPQARLLFAKADALAKGDFAAAQKVCTDRANRWNKTFLAEAKSDSVARQAAEMKKSLQKIQRVVERGDRALVILPGKHKQWFSFVREGGEWKSDD